MGKSRKAGAWTAGIVGLAVLGWGGYSWIASQFTRDEAMSRALSPDGKYLAVVRNFDSSASSFAYITIERASGSWLDFRPERVIELEGTNLHEILWKDAGTLVVRVSVDKEVGSSLESQFTAMPETWRDVSIRYQATRELQSEDGGYQGWGGPSRVRGRR